MFGYLIVVNKHNDYNYLGMANLLAATIKQTQKEGYDNVALVVEDVEQRDKIFGNPFFDKVIINNDHTHWDNRSFMFTLSPWTQTVCLDADMVMLRDTSHWIKHFQQENIGLYICNKVKDFRGNITDNSYNRPNYKKNDLPILYSGYTYFDKNSGIAQDFFTLVETITENKDLFSNYFLYKSKPEVLGTDEIFSLAAKILGVEMHDISFPSFVHGKSSVQNCQINSIENDLGHYIDENGRIKIGVYSQTDIYHYAEKSFPGVELYDLIRNKMFKGLKCL